MKKYRYHIKNLDCANCARTIEEELAKMKEYQEVHVDFSKLLLTFSSDYEGDMLRFTQQEVSKIENGVIISEEVLKESSIRNDILRIVVGSILFAFSYVFVSINNYLSIVLVVIAYAILLKNTFMNAVKLLKKGILNENFLITISAIGAFGINKASEGFMVIFLYEIGKCLEKKATGNVRKNVAALMEIEPSVAHKVTDSKIEDCSPDEIAIDDFILIPKGEKVPLDGIVVKGCGLLNTASLTGESRLLEVKKGDEVLSGSINTGEAFSIQVTSLYRNSTVKKILDLMEHATDKKTKTENFVSRAARVYTPIMLVLSMLIFLITPFLFSITYQESFYRALMILVVSCPCAIAISVPLCYFAGIGSMSKRGILVKGSNYIDVLKNMKHVVFDKTGTLTTGEFGITDIVVFDKESSENELLNYVLCGESFSTHPLAKSLLRTQRDFTLPKIEHAKEVSGKGIEYQFQKSQYRVGSADFVGYKKEVKGTTIFVSKDNQVLGYLLLGDDIKEHAKSCIHYLNKEGIETYMFTGDNQASAMEVSRKIGLKHCEYGLLPDDKFKKFEQLKKAHPTELVVFVGDGINDAPVLGYSDCGISMGSGAASAIEASDVVIMSNDVANIEKAHRLSSKTIHILKQNLVFALGIKLLVILFSFFGIGSMWIAVFADVGVTLLTILNSLRILK